MAAAGPGAVIAAWGRLGYPRRARRLWEASVIIDTDGWPDDLTALPGVGRYTAGAVAAEADDADVPAVDVNVRRVVERVRGVRLTDNGSRAGDGRDRAPAPRPRPVARADGRRRGAVPTARSALQRVSPPTPVRDPRPASRRAPFASGTVRGELPAATRARDGAAARGLGARERSRHRRARITRRRRPRRRRTRAAKRAANCR